MRNGNELQQLKDDLQTIAGDTRNQFGKLSVEQLNWKPAADRWSVAQCFDHLLTGNAAYFPIFDSVISGQKQTRVVERLPLFPKVWGRLLIKSLDPKTTRKMKAPAGFQPSSSNIPGSIIDDFVAQQKRVSDSIDATRNLEPERIVITSPAVSLVTYSLLDAFRIIVVHEKRHFQQAQRVTEEPLFPG